MGTPKTRATASFLDVKKDSSLHFASILEEKNAWDTVKHVVLKFSEALKTLYFVSRNEVFFRVKRPNGRKGVSFFEKAVLAFGKRDF